MKYTFRARNPEGRTVTVSCQAADEATARQQLVARGYKLLQEAPPPARASTPRSPVRSRAPRRPPRRTVRWRPVAGVLFVLGLLWMAWGLSRGRSAPVTTAERPLQIRLQGVKPRSEGALIFTFPELPLTVSRPLGGLADPYDIKLELKCRKRPTYGLVRAGGEARRFVLTGDPLTARVPVPPAGGP